MANYNSAEMLDNASVDQSTGVAPIKKTAKQIEKEAQAKMSVVANYGNPFSDQSKNFNNVQGNTNVGDTVNGSNTQGGDEDYIADISGISQMTSDDLDESVAQKQGRLAKLGNATVNNLVIAGTSAVGSTVGLIDGIVESIACGDLGKFYDNATMNAMNDIQESARKHFGLYHTKEWEDSSLIQKLGTTDFYADLWQNMGFTEGMALGALATGGLAGAASGALQATKIGKVLSNVPKWLQKGAHAAVSSIGEAATEAIDKKKEYVTESYGKMLDSYNKAVTEFGEDSPITKTAYNNYKDKINRIEDDANRQGNFTFLTNIGLLTATNLIEFGSIFGKGYDTAEKAALKYNRDSAINAIKGEGRTDISEVLNKLGSTGKAIQENGVSKTSKNLLNDEIKATRKELDKVNKQLANESDPIKKAELEAKVKAGNEKLDNLNIAAEDITTKLRINGKDPFSIESKWLSYSKAGARALLNNVSEGFEETAQNWIKAIASNNKQWNQFNNDDWSDFLKSSKYDADAHSAFDEFANALASTEYWNKDIAYEAMMGFMTGAIGTPSIQNGKFKWAGGIKEPISNILHYRAEAQKQADALNQRLRDSKQFKAHSQGLMRHIAFENIKTAAAQVHDKKTWVDANRDQQFSDIMMFMDAGHANKLAELYSIAANEMTDEEIQDAIEQTTKTDEFGQPQGPWFNEDGTVMSVDEVRKSLAEKADAVKKMNDGIIKSVNNTRKEFPGLSDDVVKQIAYLEDKAADRRDRIASLFESWRLGENNVVSSIKSRSERIDEILNKAISIDTFERNRMYAQKESELKSLMDEAEDIDDFYSKANEINERYDKRIQDITDAIENAKNAFYETLSGNTSDPFSFYNKLKELVKSYNDHSGPDSEKEAAKKVSGLINKTYLDVMNYIMSHPMESGFNSTELKAWYKEFNDYIDLCSDVESASIQASMIRMNPYAMMKAEENRDEIAEAEEAKEAKKEEVAKTKKEETDLASRLNDSTDEDFAKEYKKNSVKVKKIREKLSKEKQELLDKLIKLDNVKTNLVGKSAKDKIIGTFKDKKDEALKAFSKYSEYIKGVNAKDVEEFVKIATEEDLKAYLEDNSVNPEMIDYLVKNLSTNIARAIKVSDDVVSAEKSRDIVADSVVELEEDLGDDDDSTIGGGPEIHKAPKSPIKKKVVEQSKSAIPFLSPKMEKAIEKKYKSADFTIDENGICFGDMLGTKGSVSGSGSGISVSGVSSVEPIGIIVGHKDGTVYEVNKGGKISEVDVSADGIVIMARSKKAKTAKPTSPEEKRNSVAVKQDDTETTRSKSDLNGGTVYVNKDGTQNFSTKTLASTDDDVEGSSIRHDNTDEDDPSMTRKYRRPWADSAVDEWHMVSDKEAAENPGLKAGTYVKTYVAKPNYVNAYDVIIEHNAVGENLIATLAKIQKEIDEGRDVDILYTESWKTYTDASGNEVPIVMQVARFADGTTAVVGIAEKRGLTDSSESDNEVWNQIISDVNNGDNTINVDGKDYAVASFTSKAGQSLVGKLMIGEERSLAELALEAGKDTKDIKYAFMDKSGNIHSNVADAKLPDGVVPGQIFVLVPNARGGYSYIATRSLTVNKNNISSDLKGQLKARSNVINQIAEEFQAAWKAKDKNRMSELSTELFQNALILKDEILGSELAVGNTGISISVSPEGKPMIRFGRYLIDEDGKTAKTDSGNPRFRNGKMSTIVVDDNFVDNLIDALEENGITKLSTVSDEDGLNTLVRGESGDVDLPLVATLTCNVNPFNAFKNNRVAVKSNKMSSDGTWVADEEAWNENGPIANNAKSAAQRTKEKEESRMKAAEKKAITPEVLTEKYGEPIEIDIHYSEGNIDRGGERIWIDRKGPRFINSKGDPVSATNTFMMNKIWTKIAIWNKFAFNDPATGNRINQYNWSTGKPGEDFIDIELGNAKYKLSEAKAKELIDMLPSGIGTLVKHGNGYGVRINIAVAPKELVALGINSGRGNTQIINMQTGACLSEESANAVLALFGEIDINGLFADMMEEIGSKIRVDAKQAEPLKSGSKHTYRTKNNNGTENALNSLLAGLGTDGSTIKEEDLDIDSSIINQTATTISEEEIDIDNIDEGPKAEEKKPVNNTAVTKVPETVENKPSVESKSSGGTNTKVELKNGVIMAKRRPKKNNTNVESKPDISAKDAVTKKAKATDNDNLDWKQSDGSISKEEYDKMSIAEKKEWLKCHSK